jgi:hydroxymethylbilane synthase
MILLTRGSDLAIVQTEMIAAPLRALGHDVAIRRVVTRGDRDKSSPLKSFGGSGAFSSCIEEALLRGEGDGAVHSLKDLPSSCGDGLGIAAVSGREAPEDVLLCREDRDLNTLRPRASVGTSSPRRRAQLLRARPDLRVVELRGNIPTRVRRLQCGELDAIVLARAGLERLGISAPHRSILPFLPAPCQGVVALETPLDGDLFRIGAEITDRNAHLCATAERALLRSLGVGCHVPFGALAKFDGDNMLIRAEILDCDGGESTELQLEARVVSPEEADAAGIELAAKFRGEPLATRLLNSFVLEQPAAPGASQGGRDVRALRAALSGGGAR